MSKEYIVYGYPDPDNAPVLLATSSLKEAKQEADDYFGIVYEYDVIKRDGKRFLEKGLRIYTGGSSTAPG